MTLIVNGERIEESAIKEEAERLRPDYERVFAEMEPEKREAQLLEWSKENVIERVLIQQYAKEHAEPIPAEQIESALEKMKKQYRDGEESGRELTSEDEQKIKKGIQLQMEVEQVLYGISKDVPEPSENEAERFYNENKERFMSPEQIRVSHIVRHINWQNDEASAHTQILKAQSELKNGELFETVVAGYSDCPDKGGDLGYITRGRMVEEFEDVVFNLGVNEVSGVFRTRFGFHIAKLYDRKPPVQNSLEQVTDSVIGELKGQMQKKVIDEFVDRLKSVAKIKYS
ncbi:MAG: peptidylprolyl isomerase [Planctomycetota bacterium]